MRRTTTRYLVRDAEGRELIVPSLADVHALYAHGFLSDDDWIRSERSSQWVPVGRMPALSGVRHGRVVEPRRLAILVASLAALGAGIGLLLTR